MMVHWYALVRCDSLHFDDVRPLSSQLWGSPTTASSWPETFNYHCYVLWNGVEHGWTKMSKFHESCRCFFFLCGMCVWLVGDIINTSVPCCLRHPVYISTVGIVADFVSNTSFGSQEYGLMFFFGQPQWLDLCPINPTYVPTWFSHWGSKHGMVWILIHHQMFLQTHGFQSCLATIWVLWRPIWIHLGHVMVVQPPEKCLKIKWFIVIIIPTVAVWLLLTHI